jgi:hypothetical protein
MRDLEFVDPKQLLREIRASLHGAVRASENVAQDNVSQWAALSAAAEGVIREDTALRMECIKCLREEEALTVREVADLLVWEVGMVKSQFLKLRQLGLIEQAGLRRTRAGIEAVYRLNTRNPALEFVLAPAPAGMKSPHEVAERERRQAERTTPCGHSAPAKGQPMENASHTATLMISGPAGSTPS